MLSHLRSITLLFAGLLALNASSQENCFNGVDDDGNGLTDLNDTTQCGFCTGVIGSGEVESVIPNASFEETDCMPMSFSALDCATDWVQASDATSDFFYNGGGGFWPGGIPEPIPSGGSGIVGGFVIADWFGAGQNYMEYVGACLMQPMEAGVSYTLQMDVAGVQTTTSIDQQFPIGYGPLDITVFGSVNCNIPLSTYECPTAADPSWQPLGAVTYQATGAWDQITMTFTPTQDINSIIIGGPCNPPADFAGDFGNVAYFFYDQLILNQTSAFGSVINTTGLFYGNDLVLTGEIDTVGATYQWFYEGVAINGQTALSLDVTAAGTGLGCYQLYSLLDTVCDIAETCVDAICVPPIINIVDPDGCAPFNAVFVNGTDMTDVQSVEWDFGDSSPTSALTNPSHVYDDPGTYTVTLSVVSTDLCPTDTTYTALIEVFDLPEPAFTNDLDEICVGSSIAFTNTSPGAGNDFSWDFGDGTGLSLLENPSHTYNTAGLFDVELTVTDPNGCVEDTTYTDLILVYDFPDVSVLPDTIAGCTPLTINFENTTPAFMVGTAQWDLGNGDTSTDTAGVTTVYDTPGTYDVYLSVTAPGGCQADITYPDMITVYGHPVVELMAAPDSGCYPLEVSFVNTTDPAFVGTCVWDFGDGSTSDVCDTYHTYFNPGEFTASLHVVSPQNCEGDTASTLITVFDHPVADFVFGPQPTDFFNTYISFTDSSSIDVVEWAWSFGQDGILGFSSDEHPSLNFPDEDFGTYPVQLIVTNGNTCQDTAVALVEIGGYYAVWAPNAFTPDGDGINDTWRPIISDQDRDLYQLAVFDRWGQQIWASTDPLEPWTGTKGSTGLFIWKLNTRDVLTGINHEYFGHVSVLK